MGEIIKGKPVGDALSDQLKLECEALVKDGIQPKLAILRVGAKPNDLSYEKGALKKCETIGIQTEVTELPEGTTQDEYIAALEKLNNDASVNGILTFRPLPEGIDEEVIKNVIAAEKDVDCFSPLNTAKLMEGDKSGFPPCTPTAVVEILKHYNVPLNGANVVVLGRSMVVGKPAAMLLLAENATVTICHSRTKDLPKVCTEFDPKAKIATFMVLTGFVLDIVAMYVFKLTGGDAAALLGGTAALLIIIINIMNFKKGCFEATCDNIIDGFVFGIKIFAAIIPIAAFFYMGEVAPITAVLGEVLPSGSQGLLSDMGVALSNTIPLNKFAVCSIQTVVGAITGLDGSGFSGISLVGSLANVFGTAVNGSVGALCALGQIAGIWTGGGCLVPWGLISAAAICGVSPIELAKRNLKPILIGFAVTTIVAIFII